MYSYIEISSSVKRGEIALSSDEIVITVGENLTAQQWKEEEEVAASILRKSGLKIWETFCQTKWMLLAQAPILVYPVDIIKS